MSDETYYLYFTSTNTACVGFREKMLNPTYVYYSVFQGIFTMTTQQWDEKSAQELYELPFLDLIHQAQNIHRENFPRNEIQLSTLLSIKTGACPEDCSYCSQSVHYKTSVEREKLMAVEKIVEKAKEAKSHGATRFCMGAAWRNLADRDVPKMVEIIKEIKNLGMETCVTLGMLTPAQATTLKEAGLDYYNHNLDTSPEFYKKIISTRTYEDRLDTLNNVRNAGIHVCCGGIIGMGESREDRIQFLLQLASLSEAPESIPINHLIPTQGTPLENTPGLDNFEFIRTIAVARIMFPQSFVRLSAGRDKMSEEMQALCFLAGANSLHYGTEVLLTSPNADKNKDIALLKKLGIKPQALEEKKQKSEKTGEWA
jgi:biotin synthase